MTKIVNGIEAGVKIRQQLEIQRLIIEAIDGEERRPARLKVEQRGTPPPADMVIGQY